MKPSEILITAKEKISNPDKWTQGKWSKNVKGEQVPPTSKDAVCWCALGAVFTATKSINFKTYKYLREFMDSSVDDWNDFPGRTHEEVMAAFDKAISLAKSRGD